jgi:hypothetical protein
VRAVILPDADYPQHGCSVPLVSPKLFAVVVVVPIAVVIGRLKSVVA